MTDVDLLELEANVVRLEEKLIEAKADGSPDPDLKLELREARRAFRQAREARQRPRQARPGTVGAAASVED